MMPESETPGVTVCLVPVRTTAGTRSDGTFGARVKETAGTRSDCTFGARVKKTDGTWSDCTFGASQNNSWHQE